MGLANPTPIPTIGGFTAPGSFKLHLPEGDLRPRARTCQAVNESILAGVLREEQLEQPYTPLLPTFPAARGVGAQRKASGGSAVAHNCFGVAVATTRTSSIRASPCTLLHQAHSFAALRAARPRCVSAIAPSFEGGRTGASCAMRGCSCKSGGELHGDALSERRNEVGLAVSVSVALLIVPCYRSLLVALPYIHGCLWCRFMRTF